MPKQYIDEEYRHLIHAAAHPTAPAVRERSVNDLIGSSRASNRRERDRPPHFLRSVPDGPRVWRFGEGAIGGLVDVEDGSIHPYVPIHSQVVQY
jgi:hypothetical protein